MTFNENIIKTSLHIKYLILTLNGNILLTLEFNDSRLCKIIFCFHPNTIKS